MTFEYLASPYANYAGGLEKAYHDARLIVADFAKRSQSIYSPIVFWHPVARAGDIDPINQKIWLPLDEPFMRAARGCIVAMLPGWKTSLGVSIEIEHFIKYGKPVRYYDPEERIFE